MHISQTETFYVYVCVLQIARFYAQSSLKDRYYSCKVLGFR